MNMNSFERLNSLSEKALNETATPSEITEFNVLLNEWNSSAELNLFGGYHKKVNGKYKALYLTQLLIDLNLFVW